MRHHHSESYLQDLRHRLDFIVGKVSRDPDPPAIRFTSELDVSYPGTRGFYLVGDPSLYVNDREMDSETLHYQGVPVILHELAHSVDEPGNPRDVPVERVRHLTKLAAVHMDTGSPVDRQCQRHSPRWLRIACHAVYRAHQLGHRFSIQALHQAPRVLGCFYALESEFKKYEGMSLAEMCETEPADEFTQLAEINNGRV